MEIDTTLDETRQEIREIRTQGRQVAFVPGVFDLLHPGHLALLDAARSVGFWVVVGLFDDASSRVLKGSGRPFSPAADRKQVVSALTSVDAVLTIDGLELQSIVDDLLPDVFVIGDKRLSESIAAVDFDAANVMRVPILPGFSATSLATRIIAGVDVSLADAAQADESGRMQESGLLTTFSFSTPSRFRRNVPVSRVFTFRGPSSADLIYSAIRDGRMFYDMQSLLYLASDVRAGGVVIDAGANIGNHAVFFGAYLAEKVIAIEPAPETFSLLEQNLLVNEMNNVLALESAAGAESGNGVIFRPPGYTSNSGSAQVRLQGSGDFVEGDTISIETLDSILQQNADWVGDLPVTLLKIDVEGSELAVLKGATSTIQRHLPLIHVELATDVTFNAVATFLAKFGYRARSRVGDAIPSYVFSSSGLTES